MISSIGNKIAAIVPMTVTTIPTWLPFSFGKMDSEETPAEYASRKVVVTVEKITINKAAIPSPAFTMITAMSDSPV